PTGLATGDGGGTRVLGSSPARGSSALLWAAAPPTLVSIAVTPANPSITKGATQQFTATGTYSDSTTQNLTAQITWSSDTAATATITAHGPATGAREGTGGIGAPLAAVS